jgi:hypothetical protein
VIDLGSLARGIPREVLSILVGIALIVTAVAVDRAGREPYGFWVTRRRPLARRPACWRSSRAMWAGRSSPALAGLRRRVLPARPLELRVLGTIGILATTTYFTFDGFSVFGAFLPFGSGEVDEGLDPWQVALSFVAAGLLIVLLGLVEDRVTTYRRR